MFPRERYNVLLMNGKIFPRVVKTEPRKKSGSRADIPVQPSNSEKSTPKRFIFKAKHFTRMFVHFESN